MHERKLRNLLALGPEERLDYFVRKLVDFEQAWGLYDSGWATSACDAGEAVPFWPEAALAESCATGAWAGFSARPIALDEFRGRWLPGLQADNRACQVFPVPTHPGVLISPDDLAGLIHDELDQYQ
ncbi:MULTISPECIES: DUF2750 domain-containing protein [unclassified Pseudomonas]|uniref:DUF2750 domain-containing protein n=1 Tax=unclassified Pseudomonas TaxID=196821 RepID=UPI00130218F2|nr:MULTISPECIES: DUF2750 domain-containing protein [unclassified Pseudomonas]